MENAEMISRIKKKKKMEADFDEEDEEDEISRSIVKKQRTLHVSKVHPSLSTGPSLSQNN